MSETLNFTGTITKVDSSGRVGIITLLRPVADYQYAVIHPQTEGRVALMGSSPDGQLREGMLVKGEGEKGPEAIRASVVLAL